MMIDLSKSMTLYHYKKEEYEIWKLHSAAD